MRYALMIAVTALAGCATEIKVPVSGQLDDGSPISGQAVANLSGAGTFFVAQPGGLRCDGSYDSLLDDPTLILPITCSDGRTGEAIITRELNGLNGTAIATLSDGTRAQMVFGDLRYEQAFGTAKTAPRGL